MKELINITKNIGHALIARKDTIKLMMKL